MILYILHDISQKNASNLKDYLPKICDDHLFNSESMIQRAAIIANIGALNKVCTCFFYILFDSLHPSQQLSNMSGCVYLG